MTTALWRHQAEALEFVRDKPGAILHMGMGTGKTLVALSLLFRRLYGNALVICPKTVRAVWEEEIRKHLSDRPSQVVVLRKGTCAAKARQVQTVLGTRRPPGAGPAIVIVGYESSWREPLGSTLRSIPWDMLVYDEVHKLKAPGGKASRFASRLYTSARQRLGLTGTLMPHSPLDVYAQFRAIDKAIFGTSNNAFRQRYGVFGGYGGYELRGIQHPEELKEKIDTITYTVGEEVLDLPACHHCTLRCSLTDRAASLYNALREDFVAYVATGQVTAVNSLTRLLRLAQITSGHIKDDTGRVEDVDWAKWELMRETVEGTRQDEPWVIFCRFTRDVERVRKMGAELGRGVLELSGHRNELAEWQAGRAPILAAQIQAGSLGVSFTRARYCGYYSLGYSLGDYNQSQKRIHRPGQREQVTYYHWLVEDSVDEHVMAALREKSDVVEYIMQRTKQGKLQPVLAGDDDG